MYDVIQAVALRNRRVFLCLTLGLSICPSIVVGQSYLAPAGHLASRTWPAPMQQILQLGSDSFLIRQMAGQRLLDKPHEAHDWLFRAEKSNDPEIVNAARQLRCRIVHEGLLATVAAKARSYVRGDYYQRSKSIARFGCDPGIESTRALLAIVRFEETEVLSQLAAVALMEGDHDRELIRMETCGSPRVGSKWLQIWFDGETGDERFLNEWPSELESVLKKTGLGSANDAGIPDYVVRLVQLSVVRFQDLNQPTIVADLMPRLDSACHNDPVRLLEWFDWLIAHQQYHYADQLVCGHAECFSNDPRLIFRQAEMCNARGAFGQAEFLANRASEMVSGDLASVIELACHLRETGMEECAIRLLDVNLETRPESDDTTITALQLLARIHHDRQDYRRAAEVLERAVADLQKRKGSKGRSANSNLQLTARVHYYRYQYFMASADVVSGEKHLLAGLQADPGSSELLIAAHRHNAGNLLWQAAIDELTEIALQIRNQEIERLQVSISDDPRERESVDFQLAAALNGYAWLAAQTNHQLTQAEQYARRARQLSPANPHVLDTLAACLYAQANYREAIAMQSRAIALAPLDPSFHSDLMRYRQALATAEWSSIFR